MDSFYNRVARRRTQGQRGFTLIELLVVIAVLAILAFIVIFNVVGVANRGNSSACATDVKSLQSAVDSALNDGKGIDAEAAPLSSSGNDATILVPQYLHTWPNTSECQNTGMAIVSNGAGQGFNVVGS